MPGSAYDGPLHEVLVAAEDEAARLRHDFIGSEHLLLGLARAPEATRQRTLGRLGIDPGGLVRTIERAMKPGTAPASNDDLPYRSGAKKVLQVAVTEATSRQQPLAGPEHLLLALLREHRGIVFQALTESGINFERARAELGRKASSSAPSTEIRSVPAQTPVASSHHRKDRGRRSVRPFLLMAAPLSWVLVLSGAPPVAIFTVACVAVLPFAGYMGQATEHLAHRTGPTVGSLLNATFGNAAELIIALIALRAGLVELVKASITGSILGNLLLIQGLSLLVGGLARPALTFNRTAAGMGAAMLALSVVSLVFPALFHSMHPEALARASELRMSEAVAAILGITYLLSLLFSLKTHRDLFGVEQAPADGPGWGAGRALAILGIATVGVGIESEIVVHATTAVTATLGLSQTFLGLIIIPVIGNAAEHATAVVVARKGQIDLALQIALGSSTQVALLVAPILVCAGVLMGRPMDLVFTPFEVIAVGLATIVTAILTLDGESHWFEGVQLLAVYAIVAVAGYFI